MSDLHSQDAVAAERAGWALPRADGAPEQIEVAPGTLSLLGEAVFGAPLVPAILDAYLKDRGHDPARKWKLTLLAAVIVSDDQPGAPEPA